MKLTFYGAAGEVTGSNYVLESGGVKIMIDCGLHQGTHYAERQNFEPFQYNPKDITAVFITHAHLDHTGRIPKLVKDGFRGTIYSTHATRDFAELMLLDSEHILLKESEREGRPPLYTVGDVNEARKLWRGLAYHQKVTVGNFEVELFDAGHILGSAIIKINVAAEGEPRPPRRDDESRLGQGRESKTIIFSGDLGNYPAPIIQQTETIDFPVDYCILESTYGDRIHENVDKRKEMLEDVIEDTVKAGGTLLIPAFAMERTQELLYHLNQLFEEGRIPRVPVFIDSPLAIKLTTVYKEYESYFNKETRSIIRAGDDILNFPGLRFTLTTEESKSINFVPAPKIIVAGSGMSQGGRILHHEIRYLPDPKNTILFIGFQAVGSLGRQIMEGAGEVKIMGESVAVRCNKVVIPGYSAHADQPRLLEWLSHMRPTLKKVYLVHGEKESGESLGQKIRDEFALSVEPAEPNKTVEL